MGARAWWKGAASWCWCRHEGCGPVSGKSCRMPHSEAFLTTALQITGGAVDDQVFQRSPGGRLVTRRQHPRRDAGPETARAEACESSAGPHETRSQAVVGGVWRQHGSGCVQRCQRAANVQGTYRRVFDSRRQRNVCTAHLQGTSGPCGRERGAAFPRRKATERATLRYGSGRDPYFNLNDEADMAAPVFGPLAIQ
jgi:hypothetical protein